MKVAILHLLTNLITYQELFSNAVPHSSINPYTKPWNLLESCAY